MRLAPRFALTLSGLAAVLTATALAPAQAADAASKPAVAPAAASQPNAATAAVIEVLKEKQKKAREEAAKRQQAVVEIDERDPVMRAAFRQAQATLDDFLQIAASRDPKYQSLSLRVGIREGKRKEFFWITPFQADGDGFQGEISNTPTRLRHIKEGQVWRFKRSEVVDWMYIDASRRSMQGNFTTCVQLAKAPPEEVAQLKRAYGLDCQR
ncbi:MAG: DUF2314 domain-containing protein [Proteobacteria bacterium]|uniref:YegJ family protein n=1 Tax=Aquabacterium sp. TaxID=1872578 RepID=UPI0035C6B758|nr:DUF2314 domain-containing protein [Pseudomonadota bacterium]